MDECILVPLFQKESLCETFHNITSETISDSAECYAGLLVCFESSPACV